MIKVQDSLRSQGGIIVLDFYENFHFHNFFET